MVRVFSGMMDSFLAHYEPASGIVLGQLESVSNPARDEEIGRVIQSQLRFCTSSHPLAVRSITGGSEVWARGAEAVTTRGESAGGIRAVGNRSKPAPCAKDGPT